MSDWLAWLPWVIASIVGAVLAFVLFNYVRTRKLPPTDEPIVGFYRIELDKGDTIKPFEANLYYNNGQLNPDNFQALIQVLPQKLKEKAIELRKELERNYHFYAMRVGMRVVSFVSKNPIEARPFFKGEQGTSRKIVQTNGRFYKGDKRDYVIMGPRDLFEGNPNPQVASILLDVPKLLEKLNEATPLIQEINAVREKNRVMQSKVDDLADDVGKLKDEVEYWKREAKRRGVEEKEEVGINLPRFALKLLPYGLLFVIGYVISPAIPQLAEVHPIFLALGLAAVGYVVKRVLGK